jgi:hypothetical protein
MDETADDDSWPPPVDGRCNGRRQLADGTKTRCIRTAGWGTPYDEGPCAQHGGARGDKPEPRRLPAPVDDGWPPPADGKCNAKLNDPKRRCKQPAGHGTDYDLGPCKRHGGGHANGRKSAARQTYERDYAHSILFGQVVEMPPMLGLTVVASKLHGLATYIEEQITADADATEDGRVQLAAAGQADVRVRLLMEAWLAVARVYKMGADANVEQQQVDLVRSYQDRVLDIVEAGLRAGGVDPDDPAVSAAVGGLLAQVSGGLKAVS